jgi:glycosyltransferase involved in cell wall biosynthesis
MHPLWLASWYPDRTAPFNGDFVQRHALALAGRTPVTVIHVGKGGFGPTGAAAGAGTETLTRRGNLTERIAYVNAPTTRWALWNKLIAQGRAFRAYRRAYREHVREYGKPELVHVHVCMPAGLFALYLLWTRGIPYVVTEHYSVYIPGSPEDFYSRPFLYRTFNRMMLRRARAVHSVSRFLLEQMERIAPLRHTVLIPNAVDTRLFRAGAPGGHTGGAGAQGGDTGGAGGDTGDTGGTGAPGGDTGGAAPFRFVHISGFQPLKNVPGILDAFALLQQRRRDWELILIGPAGEDIKAYGADLNLRWTGEIPYAEVASWLRSAGALVHFSWVENQPCVISEALCCGVPVVAAAVGGIPEVLGPGAGATDRGLLVPSRDVPALAAALERMMTTPYDREAIAAEAAAMYSYETVGAALEAFSGETKTAHS